MTQYTVLVMSLSAVRVFADMHDNAHTVHNCGHVYVIKISKFIEICFEYLLVLGKPGDPTDCAITVCSLNVYVMNNRH